MGEDGKTYTLSIRRRILMPHPQKVSDFIIPITLPIPTHSPAIILVLNRFEQLSWRSRPLCQTQVLTTCSLT